MEKIIMVTKKCTKCQEIKSIAEFHKRNIAKDGYAIYCKLCNNAINKQSYHTYWNKRREYNDKYHYSRIEQIRLWLDAIKIKTGCQNCGYNKYAVALDFHHLDLDTKIGSIASLVNRKLTKEKIMTEVQKCIILCSNCHRLLYNNLIVCENMTPCLLGFELPNWQPTRLVGYCE